jgi:hypothetical protein
MTNRYTKKPVTIEALQWTGNNIDEVVEFCNVCYLKPVDGKEQLQILTLEGPMTASEGDMIIKGIQGEFYACKPDIFDKSYDCEGLKDMGEISDGYHTFNELYEFRKMYNAALFNSWGKQLESIPGEFDELGMNPLRAKYDVHKSIRHSDGVECFGGGWFIVMAILPGGQISNHYKMEDWDLFQIPEVEIVKYPYDGHSAQDVLDRLKEVCLIPSNK